MQCGVHFENKNVLWISRNLTVLLSRLTVGSEHRCKYKRCIVRTARIRNLFLKWMFRKQKKKKNI